MNQPCQYQPNAQTQQHSNYHRSEGNANCIKSKRNQADETGADCKNSRQRFAAILLVVPQPKPPGQTRQAQRYNRQRYAHSLTPALSGNSASNSATVFPKTGCFKSDATSFRGTNTNALSGIFGCGICNRRVFLTKSS